MTKLAAEQNLELLRMEAVSQHEWAKEEQDPNPEGLAFMSGTRVISGRSRPVVYKSALTDAFDHLHEAFGSAACKKISEGDTNFKMVLVTRNRWEEQGPCKPSSRLIADLTKTFKLQTGKRVIQLLILPYEGEGSLSVEIPCLPKEPK